jgi:hypothetical protein
MQVHDFFCYMHRMEEVYRSILHGSASLFGISFGMRDGLRTDFMDMEGKIQGRAFTDISLN